MAAFNREGRLNPEVPMKDDPIDVTSLVCTSSPSYRAHRLLPEAGEPAGPRGAHLGPGQRVCAYCGCTEAAIRAAARAPARLSFS